jgi:hypothetical protein
MKLSHYPGITKVFVGVRVTSPDHKVCHILTVETNIPLSKRQSGYDQDQFDKLLRAVAETKEEIGADEVDIQAEDNPNLVITGSRASASLGASAT